MTTQEFLNNRVGASPAAPTNLRTVANFATSTTLAWDIADDATSYEVWVTDTASDTAEPVKIRVTRALYTIANLLPNHTYRIQVYSVVDAGGTHMLSNTAVEKNTTTEYVIVEDVIQCPPPNEMGYICPLTCSTATIAPPNTLPWATFATRDFHKIRIMKQRTIMAQIVLERSLVNGSLCIRNYQDLICDNTQLAVNPPSSANCPTGGPALSFCGTFPNAGATVSYRVEADIDRCVVHVLTPANENEYHFEAERCTPPTER